MAADAESEHDTDQWDEYSFVVSSQYRIATMERLQTGPATPSQIASDEGVRMTHVSRALQELREKDMVDLLVSDDRKKGRVYGTTEKGSTVAHMVAEHHGTVSS